MPRPLKPKRDEDRHNEYMTNPIYNSAVQHYRNELIQIFSFEELVLFSDLALYGKAYAEIVLQPITGEILRLKPLDPRYIRERRKKGRLIGYAQTLTFPPVMLSPRQILAIRTES